MQPDELRIRSQLLLMHDALKYLPQEPAGPVRGRMIIPLQQGREYIITQEEVAFWQRLYPGTDAPRELGLLTRWLANSGPRRKTPLEAQQLIHFWLSHSETCLRVENIALPDSSDCPV